MHVNSSWLHVLVPDTYQSCTNFVIPRSYTIKKQKLSFCPLNKRTFWFIWRCSKLPLTSKCRWKEKGFELEKISTNFFKAVKVFWSPINRTTSQAFKGWTIFSPDFSMWEKKSIRTIEPGRHLSPPFHASKKRNVMYSNGH